MGTSVTQERAWGGEERLIGQGEGSRIKGESERRVQGQGDERGREVEETKRDGGRGWGTSDRVMEEGQDRWCG